MELLEVIVGLEVASRQSFDAARFDLAGVTEVSPEYQRLVQKVDTMTTEERTRILELYPIAVGAKQDVERNQRNGRLFQEAADRLRKLL